MLPLLSFTRTDGPPDPVILFYASFLAWLDKVDKVNVCQKVSLVAFLSLDLFTPVFFLFPFQKPIFCFLPLLVV